MIGRLEFDQQWAFVQKHYHKQNFYVIDKKSICDEKGFVHFENKFENNKQTINKVTILSLVK